VESRPGWGTRVQMNLPAVWEAKPAVEDAPAKIAVDRGEGTVLVIEDEPDVMEITAGIPPTALPWKFWMPAPTGLSGSRFPLKGYRER
jgi:hypothetical protein